LQAEGLGPQEQKKKMHNTVRGSFDILRGSSFDRLTMTNQHRESGSDQ
jgi:hypothetical protein